MTITIDAREEDPVVGEDEEASRMIDEEAADDDHTKYHQMEDPSGALTFRQFAFKHLPNDATPQEAEEKYEQYKIENAQHLFHEQYFAAKERRVVAKNVRSENVRIESRSTLGVGEGTVGEVCERVRGNRDGGRVAGLQRSDDGNGSRRRRKYGNGRPGEKGEKSEKNRWVRPKRGVAHGSTKARFNSLEKFDRKVKR